MSTVRPCRSCFQHQTGALQQGFSSTWVLKELRRTCTEIAQTRPEFARGYVAVFDEDVVRHYQQFLAHRRQLRPAEEYRPVTEDEWSEFEAHFDKRKVELGGCGRPYATPCEHEHACIRCPSLHVNPKMLFRLDELELDLTERRERAEQERWLGELEGLDLTLDHLRRKREQAQRLDHKLTAAARGSGRERARSI